jgi:ATPase
VLDTIIHVEAGQIQQVLELRMTVKPPTGMQEELARPVIEVVEFPSGKITHEMFAFGSEIAVVPVEGRTAAAISPLKSLARDQLVHIIQQWVGVQCQVQFKGETSATIYAPQNMISTLIGKGGENVRQLQEELGGMHLNIESFEDMPEGLRAPKDNNWEDESDRRSKDSRSWENQSRGSKPRKGKKNRR